MIDYFLEGPIIACATGEDNHSAIALIRISGFEELESFQPFFSKVLNKVKKRVAYNSQLAHPETGELIDDVLITYFEGPKSYNGENILEINCHGNPLVIKRIIQVFCDHTKLRVASPGEFTLRALQNKKLNLSQVEGLDLLLNSQSSYGVQDGLKTLCGELHASYEHLHKLFLDLRSSIELGIDFSDDIDEETFEANKAKALGDFEQFIHSLNLRAEANHSSLLTPEIVLFGPVNAGKSSLFNQLLKNDRSIVSSKEGTTRDFISEYLLLDGVQFKIIDTAGIRLSGEEIEEEGIKRSRELMNRAFFKILVLDPNAKEVDFSSFTQGDFDLCILTHGDHVDFADNVRKLAPELTKYQLLMANLTANAPIEPEKDGPIEPDFTFGPIEPDFTFGPIEPEGIIKLNFSLQRLRALVLDKYLKIKEKSPIVLPRHRESVNKIFSKFIEFQELTKVEKDVAIVSNELNLLNQEIQLLTGIITEKDVLNNIFENFCIGK